MSIIVSRLRLEINLWRCHYCQNWATYLYRSFKAGKIYQLARVCGRHQFLIAKEMKGDRFDPTKKKDQVAKGK